MDVRERAFWLDEAAKHAARTQLQAIQAASAPHMKERDYEAMVVKLKEQAGFREKKRGVKRSRRALRGLLGNV